MLDIAAKTQAPRDRRMHRSLRAGAYGLAAVALIYCAALAVVFILGQSLPDEPAAARLPAVAIVFYDNATSMRQARVRAASARVTKYYANRLIAVGGWRPERGYNGAAVMASEALAMGVASEYLRHDTQSNDSVSNLRSAAALSQDFADATLELISDRYHLVRLGLLAKQILPGREITLVPASINMGPGETLWRLHHEVLAYASLLLPRSWTEFYLAHTRTAAATVPLNAGLPDTMTASAHMLMPSFRRTIAFMKPAVAK